MGALRVPRHPMRRISYALETLAFLLFAQASSADDAGLRRCRALADSAARLTCYDALPLDTQAAARQAPAPVAAPGRASPGSAPSAAARSTEARFGLASPPTEELPAIESHIPGLFEGWRPNERIRLANGQVWQIADDSTSLLQRREPKVTVRRGALGAFYLDIEGDNRSPRVRRVQ